MRASVSLSLFVVLTGALPQAVTSTELDSRASVVGDYRFRGESLSNRRPVGEADIEASFAAGWFAGLAAVTSAYSRAPAAAQGRHSELDVSAGWSKPLGLFTPAAGLIGYIYPGGSRTDSFEAFGSLAARLGPAALTAGINYAPQQGNLGRDNLYLSLSPSLGLPGTPVTLRVSVGREAGSLQGGTRAKIDYGAGIEARCRRLTFNVRWSANDSGAAAYNRRRASAGFSIGVGATF